MRHVFEHVPHPMATLKEIARILKPGGTFIFMIPNPDSLDARLFGRYWQGHDVPRHFYNYPPNTLRQMLLAAGLEQQHIGFSLIPNDWILSIKRMLIEGGLPPWFTRLFEIDNPLLLALFTPFGVLAGLLQDSGRVRVKAVRP
jgi:SAM-dependent methyltransferase